MLPSDKTYVHPPSLVPTSGHGLLSPQARRVRLDRPSVPEAPPRDGAMALRALEKDSPFKEKGKALCAGIGASSVMGHVALNPKEEGKRGGGAFAFLVGTALKLTFVSLGERHQNNRGRGV